MVQCSACQGAIPGNKIVHFRTKSLALSSRWMWVYPGGQFKLDVTFSSLLSQHLNVQMNQMLGTMNQMLGIQGELHPILG